MKSQNEVVCRRPPCQQISTPKEVPGSCQQLCAHVGSVGFVYLRHLSCVPSCRGFSYTVSFLSSVHVHPCLFASRALDTLYALFRDCLATVILSIVTDITSTESDTESSPTTSQATLGANKQNSDVIPTESGSENTSTTSHKPYMGPARLGHHALAISSQRVLSQIAVPAGWARPLYWRAPHETRGSRQSRQESARSPP